jgi:hypothetical protein
MLLSGNEDALDPILAAIHDLVEELHEAGSGTMRQLTLNLVLLALGDALLGQQLANSLDLPRRTARDTAEAMLVQSMVQRA